MANKWTWYNEKRDPVDAGPLFFAFLKLGWSAWETTRVLSIGILSLDPAVFVHDHHLAQRVLLC